MKKLKLLGVLGVSALMMIGAAATAGTSVDKMIDPFVGEHQGKFYSEYLTKNDLIKAGSACNLEIAREGMVLLKNKDNMLPLTDVHKVSIFGKNSKNKSGSEKWLRGGGGSGQGRVNGETPVDIHQSLEKVGWEINPTLKNFYDDDNASGKGREGTTRYDGICDLAVGETPVASYTDAVKSSFDEYNDAAVVVIVRSGSEGTDLKAMDARDTKSSAPSDKHFLQLSDNEIDMLEMVKEKFDKIIILINSGNAFQCDAFEDDKIGAVLWMGTPGAVGAQAIGEILTGAVNPSGHTVDTWTRDHTKNPTFQNFADNSQTFTDESGELYRDSNGEPIPNHTMINADGTPTSTCTQARWVDEEHKVPNRGLNGCYCAAYDNYEEGIYVDYRYYETRYADMAKTDKAAADTWYNGEEGVIYPFGYGLSYTTFSQEITAFEPGEGSILTGAKKTVSLDVKVTNTGSVAGKDVVQVYWRAPYTAGGIEKADHVLCAFGKTKMLEPGESDTVTCSFYLQDVADYDYSDANGNGFMGYELDEGEYEVAIMKNAHEQIAAKKLNVKKGGIQYKYDRYTGTEVKNQFSDKTSFQCSLPMENSIGFDHMSRSNFETTFPKHPTIEERTLPANSRAEEYLTHSFIMADLDVLHNGYVSEEAYKTKEDIEALGWTQQEEALDKGERIQAKDMFGVAFDDTEKWDEFLNEFTYAELRKFVEDGAFHNPRLDAIGKSQTTDSDGPNQFEIIWWCGEPTVAATFNLELATEQGKIIGCESFFQTGTCGWLGNAVNMHRSPFGGRNFEYYAADPFLMGRFAGRVVDGASKKGVYCYFKHVAVNDQEKNREGTMTFVDEQALRQLYLRPFQMVVQEGHSRGIMSSYNRLGMMETGGNYNLLTNVLRKEWGFKGAVMSDMDHKNNSSFDGTKYENINWRCLSGCNAQLDNSSYGDKIECKWDDDEMMAYFTYEGEKVYSYSWYYAVRSCAKEILYAGINCAATMGNTSFLGEEVHGVSKASATKININEAAEISFELADDAKYGKGDAEQAVTSATDYKIDIQQVDHALPAGMEATEDGKLVGTPTKRGVYPILVWATITLADGTEKEVAEVFDIEVYDPNYEAAEEAPAPTPEVEGLPLAAIIGISVGGGVLVLAGGFALVWFLVIKKGKKEAKAE